MVELVLIACLLKEPKHCEEFHIPLAAGMKAPQCVWQSQMQAAQWAGDHPGWLVRKLSCEMTEA